MADEIDFKIIGNDMQIVEVELDPGESVRAEAGAMMYMGPGIKMETSTGGGLLKGFKRAITGETFFITSFTHEGNDKGYVAFGAPYPGKVIPLDLGALGGSFLCQKDSFLCAAKGTEVDIALTKKIGAGLFGGEGFILQRLRGDGMAFVHAGGTIIKKDLKAGETIRVDTGCITAFSESVKYDIQLAGGFKNALFGGEGLVLASLTGPGTVYLQSLPFSRLADRIMAAASHQQRGESKSDGALGAILGGDRSF
ncbi:TIGR00266 family protein [Methanolobus sp. ZRKC3]|uniref:TIGR00266 family protein n=1 Tax=Methanolobus sp. ZRKC3 TaxID=3125786 RepID=UPI0032505732